MPTLTFIFKNFVHELCWLYLDKVKFYSVVPVPLSNCVVYILDSSKDQLVELSLPYVFLIMFCLKVV